MAVSYRGHTLYRRQDVPENDMPAQRPNRWRNLQRWPLKVVGLVAFLAYPLIPAISTLLLPTTLPAQALAQGIDPALFAKAKAGDAESQARVGWAYRTGKGVTRDSAQAAVWFRKAAEQGNAYAQYALGWLYRRGIGVPRDYAQAATWDRKAAEQGYPDAQFELGALYVTGHGVPRDYAQAVDWFRQAAEQGNASAQASLGTSYEDGRGITRDYEQAAMWYRKAAEQGSDVAQTGLGFLYSVGHGVPQDYEQAVIWYRKADKKDNYVAQYLLSSLYFNGQGVPQSYWRAESSYHDGAMNEEIVYGDTAENEGSFDETLEPDQADEAYAAVDKSHYEHWLFMLIVGGCFAGLAGLGLLVFVYGRKLIGSHP